MRVKYLQPGPYFGEEIVLIYQDTITKICHTLKAPRSIIPAGRTDFVGELYHKMLAEWGHPLTLEDCGVWDNTPDEHGRMRHPFDKNKFVELELDFKMG